MENFILIADDDPALLKLVGAVVEGEGFLPATARDGKEAYAVLKSGANILGAIIDLNMPYIDGNDLVKFMKRDERFSKIPVLVMTGDRDPKTSSKALKSGAMAFLPKPFTNMQLRTALRTMVGAGVSGEYFANS